MSLNYDVDELIRLVPEVNRGGLKGSDLEHHLEQEIGPWLPSEWQGKGGKVKPISAMDDSHLCNTIRFLVRVASRARATYVGKWIGTATSEVWGPRGDGAQMAVEAESRTVMDQAWIDHVSAVWYALLAEGRRRGLEKLTWEELDKYGREEDSRNMSLEISTVQTVLDRDKLIQLKRIIG